MQQKSNTNLQHTHSLSNIHSHTCIQKHTHTQTHAQWILTFFTSLTRWYKVLDGPCLCFRQTDTNLSFNNQLHQLTLDGSMYIYYIYIKSTIKIAILW